MLRSRVIGDEIAHSFFHCFTFHCISCVSCSYWPEIFSQILVSNDLIKIYINCTPHKVFIISLLNNPMLMSSAKLDFGTIPTEHSENKIIVCFESGLNLECSSVQRPTNIQSVNDSQ